MREILKQAARLYSAPKKKKRPPKTGHRCGDKRPYTLIGAKQALLDAAKKSDKWANPKGFPIDYYECPECGNYHLTSKRYK